MSMSTYLLAIGLLSSCNQTRVLPQEAVDASFLTPAYQWVESSDRTIGDLNKLYRSDCDDEVIDGLQSDLEGRVWGHIVIGEDYLEELESEFYLSEDGFAKAKEIIEPQLEDLYLQVGIIEDHYI